jgi:hypothetical protein
MESKTWHEKLTQRANSLAEEFGLDDASAGRLRDFVVEIARSQYKVGNKSGIAWAFKKVEERKGIPVAQAA